MNPYYEDSHCIIYHGDCLKLMFDIPDNSIDMVCCDMPYGITACKWDTVLPLDMLWYHYKRTCKDNAAIILFCAQPFTSALVMSQPKLFKYDWVWKKPRGTGHLNVKKQPLRDKEDLLVFYEKQPVYNPQFTKGDPYTALKGGKNTKISKAGETTYGKFFNGAAHRNDNKGFRYPCQTINFGVVERGTLHPTQKPIALIEYLIKTYTNEGDMVLDNCMGSGTTLVACKKLNRKAIGIETEEKYCKVAIERLNKINNLNLTSTCSGFADKAPRP